jgi:hypothetical protein
MTAHVFDCEEEVGCRERAHEYCIGCVMEGLDGISDDCRFENPSALIYLDHCPSCSCQDEASRMHVEGFVACPTHRASKVEP